jgi:hypothetical protein
LENGVSVDRKIFRERNLRNTIETEEKRIGRKRDLGAITSVECQGWQSLRAAIQTNGSEKR